MTERDPLVLVLVLISIASWTAADMRRREWGLKKALFKNLMVVTALFACVRLVLWLGDL